MTKGNNKEEIGGRRTKGGRGGGEERACGVTREKGLKKEGEKEQECRTRREQ